jgi:hypothetical protein
MTQDCRTTVEMLRRRSYKENNKEREPDENQRAHSAVQSMLTETYTMELSLQTNMMRRLVKKDKTGPSGESNVDRDLFLVFGPPWVGGDEETRK